MILRLKVSYPDYNEFTVIRTSTTMCINYISIKKNTILFIVLSVYQDVICIGGDQEDQDCASSNCLMPHCPDGFEFSVGYGNNYVPKEGYFEMQSVIQVMLYFRLFGFHLFCPLSTPFTIDILDSFSERLR